MSRLRLSSRQTQALIVASIFLLSLLVTAFLIRRQYNDSRPVPGSTYSPHPGGAKAAFLTLKRLGYDVDRWQFPANKLSPKRTVLINAPPVSLSSKQWRDLDRLARNGGRVIFIADHNVEIDGRILWRHTWVGRAKSVGAPASTAYARFFGNQEFRSSHRITSNLPKAMTLIGDKDGALLLSIERGRGDLIGLADAGFFSNAALKREPGRIAVLIAILGPPGQAGQVLFDEWIHGIRSVDLEGGDFADLPIRVWRAFPIWLKLLLVQAALILLAWMYSDGTRVGPAVGVAPGEDVEPADYVTAMADLYRRAGARRGALAIIYNRFMTDVTGRRLPGAERDGLAAKLVKENAGDATLLRRSVQVISAETEPNEGELVSIANRLATLRKEIKRHA